MKNYGLSRPADANQIDGLVDGIVNIGKYSDAAVVYPSLDKMVGGDGVMPEWLYAVYNGANTFSELAAILQYTAHETIFASLGQLFLGIAMVEMKHFAVLADVIQKLGGTLPVRQFNNKGFTPATTPAGALEIAMSGENETIAAYTRVGDIIEGFAVKTPSMMVILQLLSKLLADEHVHLALLADAYKKLNENE